MFTGCGTALVTPFRKDLSLDEDALRRTVRRQVEGGINFLVFAITAFVGPIFANHIGKTFGVAADLNLHFQKGVLFWIACCAAAIVLSFFLRETGRAAHPQPTPK